MKGFNKTLIFVLILFMISCQNQTDELDMGPGVAWDLAAYRAEVISNVEYDLFFDIPANLQEEIPAKITIRFDLSELKHPLVLDFKVDQPIVKNIVTNETKLEYELRDQHIFIDNKDLSVGNNELEINFIAGEQSLNRSEEYLYTLLVPDRAATVFPCFDQPNLKANYKLQLDVPKDWVAMGNGKTILKEEKEGKVHYEMQTTKPFSTYLFAFTAGKYNTATQEKGGREMTMFYREPDRAKAELNIDSIFNLHASAISWLEEYTGIPYPFGKFDFALIPTFQYGGMEHVGSIFYREGSLMLDKAATTNQKMGRASLIAHETAHMWFGDLVTMEWFNDVWLKEVFANFMAAKVVHPSFPEINHDLRFMMAHQPTAYGEDRTPGSHPIQQKLENLKDAGTLYGRIIYQKAPVVMKQLEAMVGEQTFREGLQEYLKAFSYKNAVWDDLINILDGKSELDLKTWSEVWVKDNGMPVYTTQIDEANGEVNIRLTNSSSKGLKWQQQSKLAIAQADTTFSIPIQLESDNKFEFPPQIQSADFVLPNGSSMSYGYFTMDEKSRMFLLKNLANIEDPLLRGAARMNLYEDMLNGTVDPSVLFQTLIAAILQEKEPLNLQSTLGTVQNIFWKFFNSEQRNSVSAQLESNLWKLMNQSKDLSSKVAFFRAYRSIAISSAGLKNLQSIWSGDLVINGLPLSENDFVSLANRLALLDPDNSKDVLDQQLKKIKNPDRKKRFEFVMPSLSADAAERDAFFESLTLAENRHYEPWVGEALSNLNHPLREKEAIKYIRPSLELMEEIQITGDIFFPKRWIVAAFNGHRSPEAVAIVNQFLEERPDYPYRLKNKILQAADQMFRAAAMN